MLTRLRARCAREIPGLWGEIQEVCAEQLSSLLQQLRLGNGVRGVPKTFNDPVWGAVQLLPHETALLDTPLLQRLRGVRQLGMAYLVYPGANHSRLEHSLGSVEVAQRMLAALELNAEYRREYGSDPDPAIPPITRLDRFSVRLAALLHDIGHGPYSHATEGLIATRHEPEVQRAKVLLKENFAGADDTAAGEALAALMVVSPAMGEVFERLGVVSEVADLAPAVAARILGSSDHLGAQYLSGVISGPLDADTLDYMARDSYHSGFPVGLDAGRLISKLEVVRVTRENAFNAHLRERAAASPSGYYYDMGLSLAGLGAYEQMLIGRVLLYDRLYYHHKIRAAEEMVRALIRVAEEEAGERVTLAQMLGPYPDDAVPELLGGVFTCRGMLSGKARARALAAAIRERRIFKRAFSFGLRFIRPELSDDEESKQTRQQIWNDVLAAVTTPGEALKLSANIHAKAHELADGIPLLSGVADGLHPEQVLVSFPANRSVVRGDDILTRTDSGTIAPPTLFFDPERWSNAYEQHKHAGYVFCPSQYREIVNLASKIVFYESFDAALSPEADAAAKMSQPLKQEWIEGAVAANACSKECGDLLAEKGLAPLLRFHPTDVRLPETVVREAAHLPEKICEGLNDAVRGGLPGPVHEDVIEALEHLSKFLLAVHQKRSFAGRAIRLADLLDEVLRFSRVDGVPVKEAERIGGEQSELILPGGIVLENQVLGAVADPLEADPLRARQVRRHASGLCRRLGFALVAYARQDEASCLSPGSSIRVEVREGYAQVRIAVPYGYRPSTGR